MQYNKTLIIAVIAFAVGAGAGIWYGKSRGFEQGIVQGKQESEQTIKDLNAALDVFYPPLPEDIRSISGTIKAIEGSVISLEINSLTERILPIPGKEPKKEIRKVAVGDKTELVKVDFSVPLPPPTPGGPAPVFPETKIKLSDLKAGDRVTVIAEENIKTKQEFTGSKIQLYILP